jgi:hypothetical protein
MGLYPGSLESPRLSFVLSAVGLPVLVARVLTILFPRYPFAVEWAVYRGYCSARSGGICAMVPTQPPPQRIGYLVTISQWRWTRTGRARSFFCS